LAENKGIFGMVEGAPHCDRLIPRGIGPVHTDD
jgi:hypothetical protein